MHTSIRSTFKRRFFAGLIISIPAIVTLLVISWFFKLVDGLLEPFYYNLLGYHVRGLGFISAIVIIFIIGIISTNVIGQRIIGYAEKIMLRIPVFKGIYTAVKQLVDAFSPESKEVSFKKFVLVEYPRPGVFSFGFLTKGSVIKKDRYGNESKLNAVYIPTNNLYLGEIVLFKEENMFYTDIPIDEGIKVILSGGIATPSQLIEAKE